MSLVERVGVSKKSYTLKEDVMIVTLLKRGTLMSDLSSVMKKYGFERSKPSLEYRIYRVLTKVNKFVEIERYKNVTADELKKVEDEVNKMLK